MSETPHVLQVDSATEWRGGQVQTLTLVRGLVEAGWRVSVACPPRGRLYAALEGVDVERLAVPPGVSLRAAATVARSAAHLVAAQTSHAHSNALLCRRPLVVHRRVDFVPPRGWKYRRPDGYVAVSQAVADILAEAGARCVHVVPDGVRGLGDAAPADDGPDVLAVGARVAHKGHRHLVDAAEYLPPELDIGVAGDGPLQWPGRVRWLGARDDVAALLARARVFVHPSVEEGMGQAVVEAMLAGVPVVVTDAGGLPEVVADTAVVVRKGDPRALAEGILRALEGAGPDPARARQRAEERFSVEAMVAGTIAAYRDVLARSSPA